MTITSNPNPTKTGPYNYYPPIDRDVQNNHHQIFELCFPEANQLFCPIQANYTYL